MEVSSSPDHKCQRNLVIHDDIRLTADTPLLRKLDNIFKFPRSYSILNPDTELLLPDPSETMEEVQLPELYSRYS